MPLSLSDLTTTTFTGGLGTLRAVIEAAQKHAADNPGFTPDLNGRLAPDMFTFAQQVQAATDGARRVVDRLSGRDASTRPDPEATMAGLLERLDATIEHVAGGDAARIDATADQQLTIDLGAGPMQFTGRTFVLGFALPNFMFHVTTAYDIMRHQGVPLGKILFISPIMAAASR